MNAFDTKLRAAQLRQRRRLSVGAAILFTTGLGLAVLFAYLNGTVVKISPDDAAQTGAVYVSDGAGVAISGIVYSLSDETQIAVSAPGFRSEMKHLTSEDKGRTIEVVLQELPGRLIATIDPPDEAARWKLNGERVAIAAMLDQDLEPGEYWLEVDSAYFQIENRSVTIERAAVFQLTLKLKPVDGRLSIRSLPAGAAVRLDGQIIGTTPIQQPLGGGQHKTEIALDGYQAIDDRIEVSRESPNVVRNYRLLRQTSKLSFELDPPDGLLLVNGINIQGDQVLSVPSGVDNHINYSREGYFAKSQSVRLEPDSAKVVRLELEPEYGEVGILSTPNADVYVNDNKIGVSPLTIDLIAVPQTISIQKAGFRSVIRTITPTATGITTIREVLKTETNARLVNAPRSYTNSLGMELVMFEPSTFVMGAPRHQKGQRANEFQRKIKLVKPFYAAKHETTNQQYKRFQQEHGGTGGDRAPVTSLRWVDAVKFCNWLSRQEKLEPFYVISGSRVSSIHVKANGYRLLSEPEWEWLARRAGRANQTVFAWGDSSTVPKSAANIADEAARGGVPFYIPNYNDGFSGKAPVGRFNVEPSGLYDLAGNVSEWVNDAYSLQLPLSNTVELDPMGPVSGNTHVVKGANWRSGTRTTLRPAYREGLVDRRDDVGFRIGRYL